jgi:beta-glucosidase
MKKQIMMRALVAAIGTATFTMACAQDAQIERKVAALMKQMTVAEKVGQLHQISGREFTGPSSSNYADKLADIRNGKVGSMLNVKGVADTREIQALACNRA